MGLPVQLDGWMDGWIVVDLLSWAVKTNVHTKLSFFPSQLRWFTVADIQTECCSTRIFCGRLASGKEAHIEPRKS